MGTSLPWPPEGSHTVHVGTLGLMLNATVLVVSLMTKNLAGARRNSHKGAAVRSG